MKITQAGEYGLLALMYLARQPKGNLVMIEEISKAEGVPKGFLAKILQNLNRAGMIRSRQGARGGFMLLKPAAEITVLGVLEAIEGKIAFQRCLEEPSECTRSHDCTLCAVFTEAQNRVLEVFGQMTLEDLLKPKQEVIRKVRTAPMADPAKTLPAESNGYGKPNDVSKINANTILTNGHRNQEEPATATR